MQNKADFGKIATQYLLDKNYGSVTENIGSGYNGSVFLTDKGYVIKVTSDEQEYKTTLDIFNSANGKYTPLFFEIDPFEGFYVIIMEKVEPLKLSYNDNILLNKFRDILLDYINNDQDIISLKNTILKNVKDKKMAFILTGVVDCVDGLRRVGIINADIQENNIGKNSKGNIVLFDVVDEIHLEPASIREVIRKILKQLLV